MVTNFDRSTVKPPRQNIENDCHQWPEMEPGLRVTGHRVSNLGPGRVTGQSSDLDFDPGSCSMQ